VLSPLFWGELFQSINRWRVRKFTCSSAPFISHCIAHLFWVVIAETKKTNDNNNTNTVVFNKVSADGFHFRGNSVDQLGHVGYSLTFAPHVSELLARG
jgi:hypothetical protein